MVLTWIGTAHGQNIPAEPAGSIQRLQTSISHEVLATADRIDAFLGEGRVEDDAQRSVVRLRLDTDYDQADGTTEVGVNLNAKLDFPRTQRRLSLLIGADGDDDSGPAAEDDDNETAGLRGDAKHSLAVRFHALRGALHVVQFDAGLRRRESRYRSYVRGRTRRSFTFGERWGGRWSDRLYYFDGVGFENELRLDLERHISDRWFFRSQSLINWYEDDQGTFPEQHFSFFHQIDSDEYLALEWRNFFSTSPEYQVDETQLRVRYRRSMGWKWFFLELRPVLAFPEVLDYDATWRLKLRMEALFGAVQPARRN